MTPTLVVVSGPPGSGKTTLAHQIAAAVGCPVISRDEIKQGMARNAPGFTGAPGDELTRRTFPVFFAVLDLLLRSGVTTELYTERAWYPAPAHLTAAPGRAPARPARRPPAVPPR